MERITAFDAPVSLARDYYECIEAPEKQWIVFEQSAHFPFFEEPARFAQTMKTIRTALE